MKLLKEYGSVEAVIKNVARIPGTLGQKIAQHTKSIRMSYDLATIKRDCLPDLAVDKLKVRIDKGKVSVK